MTLHRTKWNSKSYGMTFHFNHIFGSRKFSLHMHFGETVYSWSFGKIIEKPESK